MSRNILKHFDDLRHCPVCKQEFKEPKLIPCGHTFCLQCIEPLQHKFQVAFASRSTTLTCPVCSKVCDVPKSGVQEYPPVFMANQAKTAFHEVELMLKKCCCDVCEKTITEARRCGQCSADLCQECAKVHGVLFPSHVISSVVRKPNTIKCPVHQNQRVTHFCTKCLEPTCPLCATKHHANKTSHKVVPAEEASDSFIKETNDRIKKLEENHGRIRGFLSEIVSLLDKEKNKYHAEKSKIKEQAEAYRKWISKSEEETLNQLSYRHDQNMRHLKDTKASTKFKFEAVAVSLNEARETLSSLRNGSLFQASGDSLVKRLRERKKLSANNCVFHESIQLDDYCFQKASDWLPVGSINPRLTIPDYNNDDRGPIPYADDLSDSEEASSNNSEMSVTRIKEVYRSTPQEVAEHLVTSAIDGTTLTMVGVGTTRDGVVICAFNAHGLGQVVLSRSTDDQQVIYHRRRNISAFAVSAKDKCGVALKEDDNLNILSLHDLQPEREATCLTHRHSYSRSKSCIQSIVFNSKEEIIISDAEKNTVTGFDAQWRRPFNISGKAKNADGTFQNAASITVGPDGEIIVFDNIAKKLVVFNCDTKYNKSISLDRMSDSCTIACHVSGLVYVADSKMNNILRVDIRHETVDEILNSEAGIKSPCCISVKGNTMAVSNMLSFGNASIKLFHIP